MKIVKCKECSGVTHVFPLAGNAVCVSCKKPVDIAGAVAHSFKAPFSFLNGKLEKADKLIAAGSFEDAKAVIWEVMETAPGPNIGALPGSGEVYWRKLLADAECKTDAELLGKGKLLKLYPAFNNAMKYGSDDEKRIYTLVENTKEANFERIKSALEEKAVAEKINMDAERILGEYKKAFDAQQEKARADVARLEEIEEEMREKAIDCGIVVGEYKNSVDAVFSDVDSLKDSVGEEITQEQKIKYEKQLSDLISLSDMEVGNQKKLAATDAHYLKYSELLGKQKDAVSAVKVDISLINGLREKIAALLGRIDSITKKYADAVSDLENGNYATAMKLLSA
jgi:hypothetical protein